MRASRRRRRQWLIDHHRRRLVYARHPLTQSPNWDELAYRLASLLGIRTSEPVERFCKMIADFPEWGQHEVVKVSCGALGWQVDPEQAVKEPDPVAALFRTPTIDDLLCRLRFVVERMRVSEFVILTGLYCYLRSYFLGMAQTEHSSAIIDKDLDWLNKMHQWRKLPLKERPASFTDEMIDRAIRIIKEKSSTRKEERMHSAAMAELLESKYNETFSSEYWQDWLSRMAKEVD
jgi:hypothetical protein